MLASGLLLVLGSISMVGLSGFQNYVYNLLTAGIYGEPAVGTGSWTLAHKGAGLSALIKLNLLTRPSLGTLLYIVGSGACIALALRAITLTQTEEKERGSRFDHVFSFDLALSLFLAPHLYDYDLTSMIIPMSIFTVFLITQPRTGITLISYLVLILLFSSSYLWVYSYWGTFIMIGHPVTLLVWILWHGFVIKRQRALHT